MTAQTRMQAANSTNGRLFTIPEYRAAVSDARDARAQLLTRGALNLFAPCWLRNKAKGLLNPDPTDGRHSQPPFGTAHP